MHTDGIATTRAPSNTASCDNSALQVTLHAPSLTIKAESMPLPGKVTKIHHPKAPVIIQAKNGTGWKIDSMTTNKKRRVSHRVLARGDQPA